MGSDTISDDSYTWCGKNASMEWKLVGEKMFLVPLRAKKLVARDLPDGSVSKLENQSVHGWKIPGWQGAPWAPVDNTDWTPRP